MEPTPIDPTRIITVPHVPLDCSRLGSIVNETDLADLCNAFKEPPHDASLAPFVTSEGTIAVSQGTVSSSSLLLFNLKSTYYNDAELVDDLSKNMEGIILSAWCDKGMEKKRDVKKDAWLIMMDCDSFDDDTSTSSTSPVAISIPNDHHDQHHPASRRTIHDSSQLPGPSLCHTTSVKSSFSSAMNIMIPSSKADGSSSMVVEENETGCTGVAFRVNQTKQWYQRYLDLVKFQETHGHCLVPLNQAGKKINLPSLAHWVSLKYLDLE